MLSAIKENDIKTVRKLVREGVDVNACEVDEDCPYYSKRAKPHLVHAALYGQLEILKVLVDAGADIHVTDYVGSTLLMDWVLDEENRGEGITYIVALGLDPDRQDDYGSTALSDVLDDVCFKLLLTLKSPVKLAKMKRIAAVVEAAMENASGWVHPAQIIAEFCVWPCCDPTIKNNRGEYLDPFSIDLN